MTFLKELEKRLVLGAWRWADNPMTIKEIEALLEASLESGITTLDHADIYGNHTCEVLYGRVLKDRPEFREKFRIVTKCGIKLATDKFPEREIPFYDTSESHILESLENSLQLLGVEKIDLLLIHRPDPLMNVDEVAQAFNKLRIMGKVLEFGVSNFNIHQYELLQSRLDFPLVTNQIEIALTHSEPLIEGTVDYYYQKEVPLMAWSPFGGGEIFSNSKLLTKLEPMAEKYDTEVGTLIIAWLLRHPSGIIPVLGTTNPQRLKALAGATDIELDREDWFKMLKAARGYDIP